MEEKRNLSDLIHCLEDLFTGPEVQINLHSLLQIIEAADILERILQIGKHGIWKLRGIIFFPNNNSTVIIPGPRLPLSLRSLPGGINPDRISRSIIPLAVGGWRGRRIGISGDREVATARGRVLEQEIKPNSDGLG